jgi:hypothetical protein
VIGDAVALGDEVARVEIGFGNWVSRLLLLPDVARHEPAEPPVGDVDEPEQSMPRSLSPPHS